MVAELAGISTSTIDGRASLTTTVAGRPGSSRPKWIQAATREPIYSILDSKTRHVLQTRPPPLPPSSSAALVVVIRAADESLNWLEEQRKLSYVWLPGREEESSRPENVEDTLYSVVRKSKKSFSDEEETDRIDRELPDDPPSERIEVRNGWRTSVAMYSDGHPDYENPWHEEATVAMPKGVVGLVGPYRVYKNPNERREYMLQEEELIEETKAQNEDVEHRSRAKWKITREDDEETLVPDIRDLPFVETKLEESDDWRNESEKSECRPGGTSSCRGEERPIDTTVTAATMRNKAGNEQHDKDSLNETGSTTGGTVEGAPGGAAPSRGDRKDNEQPAAQASTSSAQPARSLVSRILAKTRSPDDLLDHSEPYSQLWVVLSNVYGELIVVLTMALCLAEVMDTPVPLLSLQGVFLMYLYVGSIAVIIGIYIWVLVDSCSSFDRGGNSGLGDAELGGASLTRFGSLKRAHISRARTAPTSFYIRVGALLFGLATLVFNGLEMAMHSMMQGAECLTDVVFVHPVLHGLFTFLQMHFLFVNSQVLVERFGLAARFGFTHLAATNIAVWTRLVIWDSAQEWTYFVHLAQHEQETSVSPLNLRGFPGSLTRQSRDLIDSTTKTSTFKPYQPVSNEQISQVIALQECLNTNTLGQLWTSSMPFLYPFIVQFSLIAAAVTFVMGQNVGRNRLVKQKFHGSKDLSSRIGCDGSSKGLFLGILCMVAGIVVILIFLVVREDENFPSATLSWLTCGTLIGILTLSSLMTASGLVQVRQISVVTRAPAALDSLLSNVSLFGVQLYSVFTIVVCACSLAISDTSESEDTRARHIMLLSTSILQLVQCFAQSTLIAETSRRSCITRFQMLAKPGRQVITFLLFSNAVLWAFDTVITQNWLSQELQLRFFGVLVWGVLSRIGLPLLIFYRFHSCVLLLEAWNKCYRMPRGEHPLN
ncbi:PREDICTED: uncharacterized protein LOC106745269 isoform X2 [Dinoponera quadriceps]|uniref:Uncharacterized protein LOC106745269 isoform X2 n=1 Tax=Dinoponera quadriceps TaxID=609295 RepID=A0A6P3XD09_DINQU|nr:PREDICTED: uncharacterized protein LOC106745269 isoform X2 [Dinoponera quadriceps]